MKFTDPLPEIPKKIPPKESWWAHPSAQQHREVFSALAKAEEDRICGNTRFGGRRQVLDKFPQSK